MSATATIATERLRAVANAEPPTVNQSVVLDLNRTVWQRIQDRCELMFDRNTADQVASLLLPLVIAERRAAAQSLRASAFMPVHVLREVRIMGIKQGGMTNFATADHDGGTVSRPSDKSSIGQGHETSPSVEADELDSRRATKPTVGESTDHKRTDPSSSPSVPGSTETPKNYSVLPTTHQAARS